MSEIQSGGVLGWRASVTLVDLVDGNTWMVVFRQ